MDLEIVRENLAFMLDSFRRLRAPSPPDIHHANACLLAWRRCRQLAIARLLTEADSSAFFADLAAAARIRRDLLDATAADPGAFAEHRRAGDLAGFVDAVAAGQLDLAREIATLCTDSWESDHEYEDDYWYAKVLHTFVMDQASSSGRREAALAALRAATAEEPTGQVQVAAALSAGDADAFRDALDARVVEYRGWFDKKGRGMIADPDEYATERHVFVEGLALKRFATMVGVAVVDDEPLMPREARGGAAS